MSKNIKRYNLALPKRIMDDIIEVCKQEGMTILEFIRKCVRMGVFIDTAIKQGGRLYIKRKNGSKEYLEII